MSKEIEALEKRLDAKFGKLEELIKGMAKNQVETDKLIDNNFTLLSEKIDNLDSRVASLQKQTDNGFDASKDSFADIKYELVKINRTTGYQGANDNLSVVVEKKSA